MATIHEHIVHEIKSSHGSRENTVLNLIVNTVREETYFEVCITVKKRFKLSESKEATKLYDSLIVTNVNIEDLL